MARPETVTVLPEPTFLSSKVPMAAPVSRDTSSPEMRPTREAVPRTREASVLPS